MKNQHTLTKDIESLQSQQKVAKGKLEVINSQKYKEIEVIEEKYKKSIDELQKLNREIEEELKSLTETREILVRSDNWSEAKSRGWINEFYIDALLEFIEAKKNSFLSDNWEYTHKTKLSNSIDVWLIHNTSHSAPYKLYLAFHEGSLIGTSFRDTPRHAGDSTEPFSFIGQFVKPLTYTKEIHERKFEQNSTFQMWMRKLKEIEDPSVYHMAMNDNIVSKIKEGISIWNDYSWDDREDPAR